MVKEELDNLYSKKNILELSNEPVIQATEKKKKKKKKAEKSSIENVAQEQNNEANTKEGDVTERKISSFKEKDKEKDKEKKIPFVLYDTRPKEKPNQSNQANKTLSFNDYFEIEIQNFINENNQTMEVIAPENEACALEAQDDCPVNAINVD